MLEFENLKMFQIRKFGNTTYDILHSKIWNMDIEHFRKSKLEIWRMNTLEWNLANLIIRNYNFWILKVDNLRIRSLEIDNLEILKYPAPLRREGLRNMQSIDILKKTRLNIMWVARWGGPYERPQTNPQRIWVGRVARLIVFFLGGGTR